MAAEETMGELRAENAALRQELAALHTQMATTEDLKRSEERLRLVFDAIPDAAVLVNLVSGQYIEANDRFARLIGRPKSEITGRTVANLGIWCEPAQGEVLLRRLLEQSAVSNYQVHVQPTLGDVRTCSISGRTVSIAGVSHAWVIVKDVTEQLRAEAASRANLARFRTLFEESGIGIAIMSLDGQLVEVNPAWPQMLGYSTAELMAMTLSDFSHPDDLVTDLNLPHELLAGKRRAYAMEKRYLRKDGSYFWGRLTVALIRTEDGTPFLEVGMVEDINERKHTEEVLLQLNATLDARVAQRTQALEAEIAERKRIETMLAEERDFARQIADAIGQGLVVYDRNGLIVHTNPMLAQITGYSTTELIGTSIYRLVVAEDKLVVQAHYAQRLAGATTNYEVRLQRADGTVLHALVAGAPRWQGAEIVGGVAVITDLTERRRSEDALRKSEERYHSVVAVLSEGIIIQDATGTIIDSNASAQQLLGLSVDEITGRTASDPCWEAVREDGTPYEADLHPSIVTVRTGQPQHEKVMGVNSPGFGQRWISINTQPLYRQDAENPYAVVASFTDVTQRRQLEADLRHQAQELTLLNQELAKAIRHKDEFLANVSHELRTPLTGILGLTEALSNSVYGELTERQLRSLQLVDESGRHLLNLINDILDLSKIEAGRFAVNLETLSVNDVCQASLRLVRPMAQKKGQTIQYSILPAGIVMQADVKRLKQILVNLLGNAIKFTAAGGELGLAVQGDDEHRCVHFEVWDKGIGIDPAQQELLFQPFIQLDSGMTRQFAGTGLGLALARRLSELHGGTISVASAVNAGSQFTVSLPWTAPPRRRRQCMAPEKLLPCRG